MGLVAVAGDVCTTTAVVLAASWPTDDALLVDADPWGGDLAAWFDLTTIPSLSTVVTRAGDRTWGEVEPHVRTTRGGIRVITGAASMAEARRAVEEADRVVVPALTSPDAPTVIVDTGRLTTPPAHPFVLAAGVTLVVHRQAPQSVGAAAIRIQRLAEQLEHLATTHSELVVALVGQRPFGADDVTRFLHEAVGQIDVIALPDDALAAAVLAGRPGVSARRLRRLPLMRAGHELAALLRSRLISSETGTNVLEAS